MKSTPTCLLYVIFIVGRKLDKMREIWKDIKEYEGLYQVSNLGRVKRLEKEEIFYSNRHKNIVKRICKEKILKCSASKNNYLCICLYDNGRNKYTSIHRLVAESFIPNIENKPQVNHKDGNKQNNKVDNLEWCTGKENMQHAQKEGLTKIPKKEVIQYDLDGNYVKKWDSITGFLKQNNKNLKCSGITSCCQGKQKTAYGFKWKYVEE